MPAVDPDAELLAQERDDRLEAVGRGDFEHLLPQLRGGADGLEADGHFGLGLKAVFLLFLSFFCFSFFLGVGGFNGN